MSIKQCAVAAIALATSFAAPVLAVPINVVNASFEILPPGGLDNPCGIGCAYTNGTIGLGWTVAGVGGQFQPGLPVNAAWFNYLPDGNMVGWANNGTLYQTVAPLAQLGTYTLRVERGVRNDYAASPGWIGLNFSNTNSTAYATGTLASLGNWSTWTSTFTVGAADVGSSITIVLNGTGTQGNWDDVRLDGPVGSGTVPEPASWALMITGFAMIGAAARRRRTAAIA
jgi:hypothetical protein